MIGPRAERTLATGAALKQIVLALGEVGILAIAIWQLVEGRWAVALGVLVIGGVVAYIVLDVVTGLLLLPFVGAAAVADRRQPNPRRAVTERSPMKFKPHERLLAEGLAVAANDAIERTSDRWDVLYNAPNHNPLAAWGEGRAGDADAAITLAVEELGYELDIEAPDVVALASAGAAGYVWREA